MKKNFKRHLFSSFLFAGILCHITFSHAAICPVTDIKNIPLLAGSNIATQLTTSLGAEVVTQEEIANNTRSGNASCSNAPSNKKTEITTKTYDYLEANIMKLFESTYISPQEKYETALDMLKKNFFLQEGDKESALTKLQNRVNFASEVAAEAYSLAQQLRPLFIEDMQSMQVASGKGCNQTQSNAMLNRNIKAQIKMVASQIILQIVQMEVDVVQQFIKDQPTILTLKKIGAPEDTEGDKK